MSDINVDAEGFAYALDDILKDYVKDVKESFNECGREVSKEGVNMLRTTSPTRSGAYASDWAFKEEKGMLGTSVFVIYNKKHYQLTHLLEHGHVIRNGTRRTFGSVGAREHIKPTEQWVQEELPDLIERKLGG